MTCSSIGPAVEAAASSAGVPVLRVDQPIWTKWSSAQGRKIGVIATLPTTLAPDGRPDSAMPKGRQRQGRSIELSIAAVRRGV